VTSPRRVGLLGVPFDGGSSFLRGAAGGPAAVRAALHSGSSNLWTERGLDVGRADVLVDRGDVPGDTGEDSRAGTETAVEAILAEELTPLVIGGDHSITYPILRAMRRRHRPLSILHLDAHADLYPEFNGDRFSHACPFARILEEDLADQVVQVGIRTLNPTQREVAERHGVEIVEMGSFANGAEWRLKHPTYISIDLDVLDPAFAPGVSHPEPGGMTVRELIQLVHWTMTPIVGADVVELNPARDLHDLTARVAAKLVKEIVDAMRAEPPKQMRLPSVRAADPS
jgi:agmatinase